MIPWKGFSQVDSRQNLSTEKRKWSKISTTNQKEINTCEKKKNKLQWSVTKYIKHTPEQAIYLEIFGQHKRLSMFVCVCAFFLCFGLVFIHIFFHCCCFSEKDHAVDWVWT